MKSFFVFCSLFMLSIILSSTSAQNTWIFGYGSLISKTSRDSTYPTTTCRPARVQGIKRGWFAPGTVAVGWASLINNKQQLAPTYLGAYIEEGYSTSGVVFTVNASGLAAFDVRELSSAGYTRENITLTNVTFLDNGPPFDSGDVVHFYNMPKILAVTATDATPIVTSYVDTILTGCLSIDSDFGNTDYNFTVHFIETTTNWTSHWVNDRLLPRRPWVYQPKALLIDKLLAAHLGQDILDSIVLDDPTAKDNMYGTEIEDALTRIKVLEDEFKASKKGDGSGRESGLIVYVVLLVVMLCV